jgi:hypothetical protein
VFVRPWGVEGVSARQRREKKVFRREKKVFRLSEACILSIRAVSHRKSRLDSQRKRRGLQRAGRQPGLLGHVLLFSQWETNRSVIFPLQGGWTFD